jgi:predicted nucleotidyltransferase
MNKNLLDFSRQPELNPLAQIVATIQAVAASLDIPVMIVGAMARDMHLQYRFGLDTRRQTEDADFAFAVRDWQQFDDLRGQLIDNGFQPASTTAQHVLRHSSGLPIDLIPFRGIEDAQRQIVWPPPNEAIMNTFGFDEALASAHEALLPGEARVKLVSIPALGLLKIMAWQDRHLRQPRKDAHDLMLIAANYLDLGNRERLWDEHPDWAEADDFDYERAGARLLGHDLRALLDVHGTQTVSVILNGAKADFLAAEMSPGHPGKARELLDAMLRGLRK